jgi:hypothetical protein
MLAASSAWWRSGDGLEQIHVIAAACARLVTYSLGPMNELEQHWTLPRSEGIA